MSVKSVGAGWLDSAHCNKEPIWQFAYGPWFGLVRGVYVAFTTAPFRERPVYARFMVNKAIHACAKRAVHSPAGAMEPVFSGDSSIVATRNSRTRCTGRCGPGSATG